MIEVMIAKTLVFCFLTLWGALTYKCMKNDNSWVESIFAGFMLSTLFLTLTIIVISALSFIFFY